MDQVKHVVYKFLGVLLAIPTEPTNFSTQCLLEIDWGTPAAATTPHFLHKPSVGSGKFAAHSKGILFINVRLILAKQKVIGQLHSVG